MIEMPDLVAGGLAAGTLSALALGGGLLRSRRRQAVQRDRIAALLQQLDDVQGALTAEVEHLAAERIPAAARQTAHPHVVVPGPLEPGTTGTPLGVALEGVLSALRTELLAQRTRIDSAAQAGMRGATREIQAALYRLQDALRGLQQRYDDPELAQTLFTLDHENEQSLRRAQVAAVVCGAWVGLAREESHLVDAVTGGQARLAGYHRVRVHNHLQEGTALVSHAVEPVALIVAELLDNALRHSAPDTDVLVNLEHVHHGVCVTVDDAGLGMTPDERARGQRLVAGGEPILLTDLGDPPRMGLAAIGQLTRQFDLGVDVSSPSPYGGVRAVLRVASHLLTRIDPAERPPAASAPRSTLKPVTPDQAADPHHEPSARPPSPLPHGRTAPRETAAEHRQAPAPDGADTAHSHGTEQRGAPQPAAPAGGAPHDTGGVLPQRRRRSRRTAPPATASGPHLSARTPEEAAAVLGGLQSATAAARGATDPAAARAGAGPAARTRAADDGGPAGGTPTNTGEEPANAGRTPASTGSRASGGRSAPEGVEPAAHERPGTDGGTAPREPGEAERRPATAKTPDPRPPSVGTDSARDGAGDAGPKRRYGSGSAGGPRDAGAVENEHNDHEKGAAR
ncbi:ATP-binding protein [Streptomyces sp. 6-11-2]|uniref:ATP-binding protein n=1 Tax=Streptomyces sp. 6-11-2 TaxID=2585753 RepID=UPI00209BEF2A|nr:ATP-binding protein [Streptomyces sp. 6-11-2]